MPSKFRRNASAVACVLVFATVAHLCGCRSATVKESVLPKLSGNDPQQQLDYWHTVASKPLISNDEAFRTTATNATNIDRLNLGPIPTTKLNWPQPHEGNLIDFLFRGRALQVSDPSR